MGLGLTTGLGTNPLGGQTLGGLGTGGLFGGTGVNTGLSTGMLLYIGTTNGLLRNQHQGAEMGT